MIVEMTGERVVVVTHGGVIRALHERASLGTGHRAGRILNVTVNVLHLSDPEKWVIKSWGDVSHLNGAGYLDSGFGGDRTSVCYGSVCIFRGTQWKTAYCAFSLEACFPLEYGLWNRKNPKGERTNWVMHEYRLIDQEL
ncbi:putative phosphoserine phosphatase [Helianthus annuus]|uniref:Phosphoserine phosphatase n=1 Tax=Helianthus annuus TaxID=4232 RepID=A0A251SKM6_HELAN|nr:putative phosphoserine phosphatase [Helianthus annuus]KAJ0464046.1 putative phosphoserine phosphatase [Helianthus annuus]KAJ0485586.1 putative phosphoserine phosphatase [Helianthus annuus]KAJ0656138.1 putative phosphoserine phosphatase [Helianthus annuus]KAJ0840189.1 putative phosphoserine phosphatase [Helianthus annuus]